MTITLAHYLLLSTALLGVGLIGIVINRHHVIHLLMCIELLLLAINTQFIALSYYFSELCGQIMVFFVLTVAASETAVALSILILLFRVHHTIHLAALNHLKG